jgi:glutaryl-CoA dehydrogenase
MSNLIRINYQLVRHAGIPLRYISSGSNYLPRIHDEQQKQQKQQLKSIGCPSDILGIETGVFSDEQRQVADTTRAFMQPYQRFAQTMFRTGDTSPARNIMQEMGKQGLLGVTIPVEYGGAGADYMTYGIIAREVEAVDSGFRSMMSVQSSLIMLPIHKFAATDAIRRKYLPRLATGELVGAFGLTEPDHGSDPSGMLTTARPQSDGTFILNGSKNWITNSPIADVFIIWAKNTETRQINGFIVDRISSDGSTVGSGVTTPYIPGKFSLRASPTGMIFLKDVVVPAENRLVVTGLRGPFTCLNSARFGISWGVLGAAKDCLTQTLDYLLTRQQFGRPLAANQIIQNKLADAATGLSLGLSGCWMVANELAAPGHAVAPEKISLLKRANCQIALDTARACRDMLGGNGISDEYNVIRHMLNLEAVNTYEGTRDIHGLILGRAITGLGAF